jgi:thioredoxin 1
MSPHDDSPETTLTREQVDQLPGKVLLEFGAAWCGYCRAAAPHVQKALERHQDIQHIQIEDGSGKPLGRSFRVKLWPTFVLLDNGQIVEQLVRPDRKEIEQAIQKLDSHAADQ